MPWRKWAAARRAARQESRTEKDLRDLPRAELLQLAEKLDPECGPTLAKGCRLVEDLRAKLLPVALEHPKAVHDWVVAYKAKMRELECRPLLAELTLEQLKLVAASLPDIKVSGRKKDDFVTAIAPHFGKRWFHLKAALSKEAGLQQWLEKLR